MAVEVHGQPPRPEPGPDGLGEVIGDALRHAQELVRAEVALAKDELRAEVASAKYAFAAFALGALLLNWAFLVACVGLLMAVGPSAKTAFIIAGAMLICALLTLLVGTRLLHVPEMRRTRSRLARDARVLAHAAERPSQ